MHNDTTGRHCHYCSASGQTARLTLRHACSACDRRIDGQHLYFHIPKLFTVEGLRTQARGFGCFLRAARLAAAGRTAHARDHGHLRSLKRATKAWIDLWCVLEGDGWRH
jgi:hypothetical protein